MADEEGAEAMCASLHAALVAEGCGGGEGGGGDGARGDGTGPAKLSGTVILAQSAREAEDSVQRSIAHVQGGISVNANAELAAYVDPDAPAMETEEDMILRMRKKKKAKRLEKRATAAERKRAPRRNALMEKLTMDPVVIHGMVNEDGEYGGNPAVDIMLRDITVDLGGMVLLDDANLTLVYGRRYGLIGRNGSGKTTFLKFLAAKQFGEQVPWYVQILHIAQEIQGEERSALQTVLDCDVERSALLRELAAMTADDEGEAAGGGEAAEGSEILDAVGMKAGARSVDPATRIVDIYDRLDEIEADLAPVRAATILAGLSFTPDMMAQPTASLSGGWRMRVSLARALFIEPDVLLLDEPTNHLDLHAVVWLENYLSTYPKTVVVVSHARGFLNEIVTDILELEGKKLTRYKGSYDTYEETKATALDAAARAGERTDKKRAAIAAQITKNIGGGAKAANMAKSRQKMLDKMEVADRVRAPDPKVKFVFPNPGPVGGGWGIRLVGVAFGYPGTPQPLFEGVEFSINQNSRICLVGPNGIGKSTLLNVIYEELNPTAGMVTRNSRLRVGRFTQHHVDSLTMKRSILEQMQADYPSDPPEKIRRHLGSIGVVGDMQIRPVYTLSGGQKSRIALAMITYSEPHLLLLDEPTNHLDYDSVQALIRALANFQGGVFVVSHDEHLISATCDELWIIQDRHVVQSTGDFKAYKKKVVASIKSGEAHPAGK